MTKLSKKLWSLGIIPLLLVPYPAWAITPADAFNSLLDRASHARTSGEASIAIIEPAWPGNVVQTTPGSNIGADPRVLNNGRISFKEVAMEVTIPLLCTAEGEEIPAVNLSVDRNSTWKACGAIRLEDSSGTGASGGTGAALSYRFLYEASLPAGKQTPPPFQSMDVSKNIDEGPTETVAIGIRAVALTEDGQAAQDETGDAAPLIEDLGSNGPSRNARQAANASGNPASGIYDKTGASVSAIMLVAAALMAGGAALIRRSPQAEKRTA